MKPLKLSVTTASILAMSMSLAGGAHAQTDQASPDGGDIVVTGSRIVREGYDLPTPTLVTTSDQLQMTSPRNLTEGLNKLPVFAGSTTQAGSGQGALGSGGVNQVGSFLNLRNFGAIRTLILLDGRRVPPTNFDGNVDVDTLPQALVQRVDVVTGGASAVYGSDAVTGVVNYVLDRKFTGLKGTVQSGVSTYGDGGSQRLNLAYGTSLFGGRGHLLLSGEYNKSDGVATKESRPWFKEQVLTGFGTAAAPYVTVDYGRQNTSSFGGLIRAGANGNAGLPASLLNMTFNRDGTLSPFDSGAATNTGTISSGGDGTYHALTSLIAKQEMKQAFGRFEYELSDTITMFAQGSFSESTTHHTQATSNRSDTATNRIVIYSGNAFLRPEIQQILTDNNIPSFVVSAYTIDAGRPRFEINTRSISGTLGFEGTIGGFKWDATYVHGEGRTKQIQHENANNAKFYAAVDAVRDPASGDIVCRVTLTSPGLYPGCVPINIFGRGNASQAAIDYTTDDTGWTATTKTDNVIVNVAGDLFDLWAGPVSIAVGGEWRKQSLVQTTTNDPLIAPDFTGLRGGFSSSTLSHVGVLVAGARGSTEVWEGNAEVLLPLLRDSALGQSLDISGAVRYTDYSTSGGVTTWKIGADYQPISDLRFRAVLSRDIRAPTLYDLYAATQIRNNVFSDDLTGVTATTQRIQGGNPNLVPEVARTLTLGAVFSPSFLPGFNASIDYYRIKIKNAIDIISIAVQNRDCIDSGGTSPYCVNIVRPGPITDTSPANFPISYYDGAVNAAVNSTEGIDMVIGYRTALDGIAPDSSLGIRVLTAYQPHYKIQAYAGDDVFDYAGTGDNFSKWRVTTEVSLDIAGFNMTVLNRWKSRVKWDADPDMIYLDKQPGAYNIVDVNFSGTIEAWGGTVRPFLSIGNLFNRDPRIMASSSPGQVTPVVAGDDVMGRYFTAGMRFSF